MLKNPFYTYDIEGMQSYTPESFHSECFDLYFLTHLIRLVNINTKSWLPLYALMLIIIIN